MLNLAPSSVFSQLLACHRKLPSSKAMVVKRCVKGPLDQITDDDVEQIEVVGDLIRHLNTKQVKR